jgi:copper chaperone CopZ
MNKFKITSSLMVVAVLAIFVFYGCSKSDKDKLQTDNQKKEQTQDQTKNTQPKQIDTTKLVKDGKYVCPMHPLMQSNEPIKCPICRMNMELKADINKQMSEEHENMESKFAGKKDAVHFEVNLSVVKSSECKGIIESALKKDEGVMDYHTDILNRVVHLYFDKSKTTKANIEKLISDAGYDANSIKANPDAVNKLPADCK